MQDFNNPIILRELSILCMSHEELTWPTSSTFIRKNPNFVLTDSQLKETYLHLLNGKTDMLSSDVTFEKWKIDNLNHKHLYKAPNIPCLWFYLLPHTFHSEDAHVEWHMKLKEKINQKEMYQVFIHDNGLVESKGAEQYFAKILGIEE